MRNRFDGAIDILLNANLTLPEYFHSAADAIAELFPEDAVALIHFPPGNNVPGSLYAPHPSAETSNFITAKVTAPRSEWPIPDTTLPLDDTLCRSLLPDLTNRPEPVTGLLVPLLADSRVDNYLFVLREHTPNYAPDEPDRTQTQSFQIPQIVSTRGTRALGHMPTTRSPAPLARINEILVETEQTVTGVVDVVAPSPVADAQKLPLGWHSYEHNAAILLARFCQAQLRTSLLQLSLVEAEDLRSIAFRYIDQGIFILRPDLTILAVNQAGAALGELEVDELVGNRLVDLNIQLWVRPGVPLPVDQSPVVEALRENRTAVAEMVYITTSTGVELWASLSAIPTLNAQGQPIVVVITSDLTASHRMVQALKRRESQLLAAQELAKLELWSWDATNNQIVFDAYQSDVLREFAPKGRVSTEMLLAAAGVGTEVYGQILLKVLIEGERCNFDFQFDRADGGRNTWRVWIIPELDDFGNVIDVWGTGLDVTHEREVQAELKRLAMQDALTSLSNRSHLHTSLLEALAKTDTDRFAALIMIDLDDFKGVNDTYGHNAGDDLLQQVAQRILDAAPIGSTTARLGGDEFMVLAQGLPDAESAVTIARLIHESLQVPFLIQDARQAIEHHASMGVAATDTPGREVDDFMRDADLAMYEAKSQGGNQLVVFDAGLREAADQRHDTELLIQEAFAGNRVVGLFQPIKRLSDGVTVGGEVVSCLQDPETGAVTLVDFPRIAEDARLGAAIDAVVLTRAIEILNEWATHQSKSTEPGLLRLGANLSPLTLEVPDTYAAVKEALRTIEHPELFVLEVSAHTRASCDPLFLDRLEPLKQLGFDLCLDDFGAGYSNFKHVQHRSVNLVKIHKSYAKNIDTDPAAAERLRALLNLGLSFGKSCIVDGIDTESLHHTAVSLGATHGQGDYLGTAVDWEDFQVHHLVTEDQPRSGPTAKDIEATST